MSSTSHIIDAMNNITLDDEKDAGIAIEDFEGLEVARRLNNFDVKLCLMCRFITKEIVDFQVMQHTLVAL